MKKEVKAEELKKKKSLEKKNDAEISQVIH